MNYKYYIGLLLLLSSCSTNPSSRDFADNTIYLNVSTNSPEKVWTDALAFKLNGKTEQVIPMGRIDVLTKDDAIEIDWVSKWHEGIGQALHYSIETGKKPTIALISLTTNDNVKIEYIGSICDKLNIKMIILKRQ